MTKNLKVGDKVTPNKYACAKWDTLLTKGKVYTVETGCIGIIVYSDNGTSYWSSPEQYFTKVIPKNKIGGKIL